MWWRRPLENAHPWVKCKIIFQREIFAIHISVTFTEMDIMNTVILASRICLGVLRNNGRNLHSDCNLQSQIKGKCTCSTIKYKPSKYMYHLMTATGSCYKATQLDRCKSDLSLLGGHPNGSNSSCGDRENAGNALRWGSYKHRVLIQRNIFTLLCKYVIVLYCIVLYWRAE